MRSARLVSYALSTADSLRPGVAIDDHVVDLHAVSDTEASPLTLRALLVVGPDAVAAAVANAERLVAGAPDAKGVHALDAVVIGPPVPNPDKIICVGLNYADHAAEATMDVPDVPVLFAKYPNALLGPTRPIVLPPESREVDYEGELAVVIGQRCKRVDAADALDCVAGYAVFNDVSARDIQLRTSQWTAGKTLDTFAPMSPLVPAAAVRDPQSLRLTTRLNGRVMQDASTADMVFSVAEIIAFASQLMTLVPGDVIATGTPSGVGFKREPPVYLAAGDTVAVTIKGVGRLRNPVVATSQAGRPAPRPPTATVTPDA